MKIWGGLPFFVLSLSSHAVADENVPEEIGFSFRAGPSLISHRSIDSERWEEGVIGAETSYKPHAAGGFLAEGEVLKFYGKSGFVGAGSLGVAYYFEHKEWFLPLKAHFGFAERHGARGTVYGVFQPTFSEEGVGTFAGFGGHFSYDFDLSN